MAVKPTISESCCPCCAGSAAYRLADGRRKCRECGKKFTPRPRRSRLSERVLRQVALYFWHMVPAARVAEELHLNRKSVQRHYRLLRKAVCEGNEGQGVGQKTLPGAFPAGPTDEEWSGFPVGEPVFALALEGGMIRVVFRPKRPSCRSGGAEVDDQGRVDALFFAASDRALRLGDLADFYLSIPEPKGTATAQKKHLKEVLNFWDFVRRLRKLNRCRQQQSLSFFLRELEFRFNNRKNPQIIEQLSAILQTGGK